MTHEELRELFLKRLEKEKQRYISKVTGISTTTLSYFKTGRFATLPEKHFEALKNYLENSQSKFQEKSHTILLYYERKIYYDNRIYF